MSSSQKRIDEIDILRGIAILLMILGHCFIVYPIDVTGNPIFRIAHNFIYSFHMELFFFLSGVVFKCNNYCQFIISKAKRIMIPYIIFGGCSMLLHVCGGSLINGTYTIKEGLIDFCLYGGEYWFLYVLGIIYVVVPAMTNILSGGGYIIVILACVMMQLLKISTALLCIDSVIYYLPYFIFGVVVSKIMKSKSICNLLTWQKIILTVGGIFGYSVLMLLNIDNIIIRYTKAILIITVFVVAVYCITGENDKHKAEQILIYCGQKSIRLYIMNGYLLTAMRVIICNIMSISNEYMIVSFLYISIVAESIFISKFIIDKCKILQNIFGG